MSEKTRELIPSYLKNNHTTSIRYDLCDIVYDYYKSTNFFLENMIKAKEEILEKINNFEKTNPEIWDMKNNSSYWYPYEKVNGKKKLKIYTDFYPNTDNQITKFKQHEDEQNVYDYLFDPVKLHFFVMCYDITKMNCNSESAKKVIELNDKIFEKLLNIVGDTKSYNNKNTLEHIEYYIKEMKKLELDVQKYKNFTKEVIDLVVKDYQEFNHYTHLLNNAISICLKNKIQDSLTNKNNKLKIKI